MGLVVFLNVDGSVTYSVNKNIISILSLLKRVTL